MEATPKEAFYYREASGQCPCEEWLESLRDRKGAAKIRARIARARAGNLGKCDTVGQGVLETKLILVRDIAFTSANQGIRSSFCFVAATRAPKTKI